MTKKKRSWNAMSRNGTITSSIDSSVALLLCLRNMATSRGGIREGRAQAQLAVADVLAHLHDLEDFRILGVPARPDDDGRVHLAALGLALLVVVEAAQKHPGLEQALRPLAQDKDLVVARLAVV